MAASQLGDLDQLMCFNVTSKSSFYSALPPCGELDPVNKLNPVSIRKPLDKEGVGNPEGLKTKFN